jgi:RNA polymerase sigma-70 factor, ECF subfamily
MITLLNHSSSASVSTQTAPAVPAAPRSDLDLMAEFREGHEEAFGELVERHQRGLVSFLFRLVWDRDLAEDLAQETFVNLYTRGREYEPRAKFTTYLYQIARNCWIDHLRRSRHRRGMVSLDAQDDDGRGLAEMLAARGDDARVAGGRQDLAESVAQAVDGLPEQHRVVVVLSEVQGLTYAEIGEILGIPVGTVKSRMFHAVQRLRERLARVLKGNHGPWQQTAAAETGRCEDGLCADSGKAGCAGAGRTAAAGARRHVRPPGRLHRLPRGTATAARRLAGRPRPPAA